MNVNRKKSMLVREDSEILILIELAYVKLGYICLIKTKFAAG